MWNETAIGEGGDGIVDIALCPAGPGVVPKHDTARYWGYISQLDLPDYPAVVFPVGKVDGEKDIAEEALMPMTDVDEEHWDLYK